MKRGRGDISGSEPPQKRAAGDDSAAAKLEKRREKLRLWQEKKAKEQAAKASSSLGGDASAASGETLAPASTASSVRKTNLAMKGRSGRRKKSRFTASVFGAAAAESEKKPTASTSRRQFTLEREDSTSGSFGFMDTLYKREARGGAGSSTPLSEGDVDPLDAFMMGLETSGDVAKQADLAHVDATSLQASVSRPQTISLADIVAGDLGGNVADGGQRDEDALLDDDEDQDSSAATAAASSSTAPGSNADDDAFHEQFMAAMRKQREDEAAAKAAAEAVAKAAAQESRDEAVATKRRGLGRMEADDGGHAALFEELDEAPSAMDVLREKMRKKDLKPVDHSKMVYAPVRKRFYIESPDLGAMSDEELAKVRTELEIKVRGKNCPKPVGRWEQCGLSDRIMAVMRHHSWDVPFPIQRQAIPAVMSGRDVIGVAKTGSGKTLAFILPMFRHVLDQPSLQDGDGPIALILAPARELAVQIHKEIRKFTKVLGLHSVVCYGGAGIKEQIGALKAGCEIVVATPGRFIDLLCTNAGRVIPLSRVTYVVLDEADRCFDMGFEPQIMRIIGNTRPTRQTVMFSATFPVQVERLAKVALKNPVEIVVGGRAKVSNDIEQHVEVREPGDKFPRLLQLLGLWYEKGNVLVFVDTQARCDQLFQQLTSSGYPCLSLHGGKDQLDRDYTIKDFKDKLRTLMVATSVAGRGLDVPELKLVVNYNCPNHLEDYVHRVGRTGRAGRKGTSYTFITPDEAQYSPDMVKALTQAKQTVSPELQAMYERFSKRLKSGEVHFRNSGYRGTGFTFKEGEKKGLHDVERDSIRKTYEIELGLRSNVDDEDEDDESAEEAQARKKKEEKEKELEKAKKEAERLAKLAKKDPKSAALAAAKAAAKAAALAITKVPNGPVDAKTAAKNSIARSVDAAKAGDQAVAAANAFAASLNLSKVKQQEAARTHFESEVEINDFPQQVRWKITHRATLDRIHDMDGVSITCKGSFVQPGRSVGPGERKLYLLVEGHTQYAVTRAVQEIRRVMDERVRELGFDRAMQGMISKGKYSVM